MTAGRDDQVRPRPVALRIVAVVGSLALLALAFWIRALILSDGDRHLATVTWVICMAIVVASIALAVLVAARRARSNPDKRVADDALPKEVP